MLQQQRDGGDLVGFLLGRLLSEHDPLPRRPGRDEVQRVTAFAPVVAAPRGLAVNGDDFGVIIAQPADPGEEAGFEQFRVQRREHVAQCIVAGDAAFVAVEAPEERQMLGSHSVVSTKSSAPAIVADNTRSRISGSGYRTLAC